MKLSNKDLLDLITKDPSGDYTTMAEEILQLRKTLEEKTYLISQLDAALIRFGVNFNFAGALAAYEEKKQYEDTRDKLVCAHEPMLAFVDFFGFVSNCKLCGMRLK